MSKAVIALDIDDVLVATDSFVSRHLEEWFGCKIPPAQSRSLKLIPEVVGLTGLAENEVSAAVQEYLLSPDFAAAPPVEGAVDALALLSGQYELVTITARSPEFQEATRVWVERHFPDLISAMYFPNTFALTEKFVHVDKNAALVKAGASWLIDDSPSHFDYGQDVGIQGILFGNYPWNRSAQPMDGVERARDWAGVLGIFEREKAIWSQRNVG